jgi:hypothetical protein
MADIKLVVDCSTGQVEEIELTAEEIAQRAADVLAFEQEEAAKEQAKADKETARQAVLTKLGLTAEEAAALLA